MMWTPCSGNAEHCLKMLEEQRMERTFTSAEPLENGEQVS